MKWLGRILFTLGILAFSADLANAADPISLDGNWDGTLGNDIGKLRLVFHIDNTLGTPGGTLKSVDQGGVVFPLSEVKQNGEDVAITLTRPVASFRGRLSADGQTIAGTWTQNGQDQPLVLTRRAEGIADPVVNRPQEPHPPYPYRSEDVVYGGPDGNKLAGTLTIPESPGPYPAAILILGSGPHDRNETVAGHKPFLVLADYLTRHGIAVLRTDKRGVGQSTGDYKTATSQDFAKDVEAAIVYLKTRPEIDSHKIGLIGHSEGGLIAPMVAAKDHSVAFVVLMAGPGLRGDEIILKQRHLIAQAAGASPEQLDKVDGYQKRLMTVIEDAKSDDDARAKTKAFLTSERPEGPEGSIELKLAVLTSPWYRFFLTYDPAPTLRQVHCPVLAINGSKDLQVPPKEDLAAIKEALANNPDAETIELPGLNHLFQTANTGAPSEYRDIEETIAPVALETIASWVEKHTR